MGPTLGVPDDVARALEGTDLVEAVVIPDALDEVDVQLGPAPTDFLVLTETPKHGFGLLVNIIMMSEYAKANPSPFELVVRDEDRNPHSFSGIAMNEESILEHLKLTYFGEPGDRRPLIP